MPMVKTEPRDADAARWGPGRKIVARYGFDEAFAARHNQAPHFSITAEVYRPGARDIDAGGCLHEEIAEAFPELVPLLRWHLINQQARPMHYTANAAYWAQIAAGCGQYEQNGDAAKAPDHFRSTTIVGAVPAMDDDATVTALLAPVEVPPPEGTIFALYGRSEAGKAKARSVIAVRVERWAEARMPGLLAAFRADMAAAGVKVPA